MSVCCETILDSKVVEFHLTFLSFSFLKNDHICVMLGF